MGDALRRLERYSSLHNEAVHIAYRPQTETRIVLDYMGVARASDCHQIEFFAIMLVRLCRHITGRRLTPNRVRFAHRRSHVPAEIKAMFGCEVEYGTGTDEIALPLSVSGLAVVNADAYLNSLLRQYCSEIMSRRPGRSGAWGPTVENAIALLLPHGEATTQKVADSLGVSRRTLARRLAAEGLTFSDVLKELRLNLTRRYLREPDLKIAEVAWLVGYQEISAFSHAVRRWTGLAPAQLRASAE